MDMKTFGYLYYKTRGHNKEDILKHAEISAGEYDMLESSLQYVLAEIENERPKAASIGNDFVRLTRYVYGEKSDQESGIERPDALRVKSGEITPLPAVGKLDIPDMSLRQAIEQRRSLRKYASLPLSAEELSFVLWSSCWARDFRSNE